MIFERNVNTRALFSVEITDEGTYFAVRDTSPMFCLEGKTIQEACKRAEEVFEAYKQMRQ